AIELEGAAFRLETRYLAWGLGQGGGLGARLGFGLDTVFSAYEALDWVRFVAMENRVTHVPLVTGGIVWQVQVGPKVRFEISVGAELDLLRIHYEVSTE